ncbi:hypothetical protein Gohar_002439 [Gossypium harknessii]|uniref:Uncharacterized protein n=1 Tax=Gossypium harknessii TaxID=34285 RepID=A0A7J9HL22_9ROSI|nr:hypothetical protein [Gossypium harknessii]
MSKDTQSREGNCQIASFDSSLPQIIRMDCKRNREDKLKRIWQSWDKAKKMHIRDKDAMGKASSDRHLALFAFAVYGLVGFPKALGYKEKRRTFLRMRTIVVRMDEKPF